MYLRMWFGYVSFESWAGATLSCTQGLHLALGSGSFLKVHLDDIYGARDKAESVSCKAITLTPLLSQPSLENK